MHVNQVAAIFAALFSSSAPFSLCVGACITSMDPRTSAASSYSSSLPAVAVSGRQQEDALREFSAEEHAALQWAVQEKWRKPAKVFVPCSLPPLVLPSRCDS